MEGTLPPTAPKGDDMPQLKASCDWLCCRTFPATHTFGLRPNEATRNWTPPLLLGRANPTVKIPAGHWNSAKKNSLHGFQTSRLQPPPQQINPLQRYNPKSVRENAFEPP